MRDALAQSGDPVREIDRGEAPPVDVRVGARAVVGGDERRVRGVREHAPRVAPGAITRPRKVRGLDARLLRS